MDVQPFLYTSCDISSKIGFPTNFEAMTKTWFNVENSSQQEEPGDGVKESLNKRFGILYVHCNPMIKNNYMYQHLSFLFIYISKIVIQFG